MDTSVRSRGRSLAVLLASFVFLLPFAPSLYHEPIILQAAIFYSFDIQLGLGILIFLAFHGSTDLQSEPP